MRAFFAGLLALGVLLYCGFGLFVVSLYIGMSSHGATLRTLGALLTILGWGVLSAVGVLGRWEWGRKTFLAWGAVTSLALCFAGFTSTMRWSSALPLLGGVLLASLAVAAASRPAA